MQPSKEDCTVLGEAVRVAAPQIALRRDFRKLFSDSRLFRLFLNLIKKFLKVDYS